MKPLFFTPLLKQVIWGGEEVTALKGTQPAPERIGESWEISGVSGDETPVWPWIFAGIGAVALLMIPIIGRRKRRRGTGH